MKISIDGLEPCTLANTINDLMKCSDLSQESAIRLIREYIVTRIDDVIHAQSNGNKSDLGPLSYYWDIID